MTAIALPGLGRIPESIEAWIRSDALAALMRPFGGTPPTGSLAESLVRLERFSDVWNYRGGGERSDIQPIDYPNDIDDLVEASARALGLAGRASPRHDRYDHMLILGGGPRTALARSAFAQALLSGGLIAGHVSALSSLRQIDDEEQDIAERLGLPRLGLEAELMAAGLIRMMAIGPGYEQRGGVTARGFEWWVRTFGAVDVLAAPASAPPRANTADTYEGWARYVATPKSTDRVLVVTTDLFVPFQHCDAVRLLGLPYGCEVDTIGLDLADYPDYLRVSTQTAILQEVRSAIRSMRALYLAWNC